VPVEVDAQNPLQPTSNEVGVQSKLCLVDFDPIMSAEMEVKSLSPIEEAVVLQGLEATAVCGDAGKVSDASAMPVLQALEATATCSNARKVSDGSMEPNSCKFGSKEEPSQADGSVVLAGTCCGEEIYMKPEMMSGGLDELPVPDQLLAAGIGDLAVKDDVLKGAVVMETTADAAPADVVVDTTLYVKEEGSGGKQAQESSEEEDESSEASSSSAEEEEESKEDEESSEASSSSDDEELGAKKQGGAGGAKGDSMEALLEEGELMVGSDDEEDVPKGPIKSKNEAEVLGFCPVMCIFT
jgi:H/ACA ribonucleoprotein complex non-core subunit NAF1